MLRSSFTTMICGKILLSTLQLQSRPPWKIFHTNFECKILVRCVPDFIETFIIIPWNYFAYMQNWMSFDKYKPFLFCIILIKKYVQTLHSADAGQDMECNLWVQCLFYVFYLCYCCALCIILCYITVKLCLFSVLYSGCMECLLSPRWW